MNPRASNPVQFDGFDNVRVIEVIARADAVEVPSGGYPGSDNSPLNHFTPGITYWQAVVEGDFGHRTIGGTLSGRRGVFHKVRTRTERDQCMTLFTFVPNESEDV